MSRNAGLGGGRVFSRLGLGVALTLLAGCAGTNDPWNLPQSKKATPAPSVQTSRLDQAAPQQASQPQGRAAKVAILLPMSGKGSDTGQAMLNAAQLAIFDMGAENFELIPRDTTGTTEGARAAAQTSIDEGAQLILGPVFAADAKAVTPVALQRGIGVVSFSTDSSAAGGNSFVLGFLPQTQVTQIIDYAAAQGLPRIALIAPSDAYGNLAASAFDTHIRQRNLMNAGLLRYNANTGPTPEQIKTLITSKGGAPGKPFDAVLIAAAPSQAAMISQQLTQAGLPPTSVQRLGTGLWDQPEATRLPGLQGAWYAASSPRLRAKFDQRYQQTYGEAAPRLATLAYDATALAIVLARSGQNYTRQTLINPNGFAGIDGIFRFRADGLVERGLAILEIRNNVASVVREAPNSFQSIGG